MALPRERLAAGSDLANSLAPRGAYPAGPAAHQELDLVLLWSAIKEHRRFIFGVALLLWLVVMAQTLLTRMEFQSTGRLYLGELDSRPSPSTEGGLELLGNSESDVASEVEIIRSRSIMSEAVAKSGMAAYIGPLDWSPPRFWEWLLSRRDPKLLRGATREVSISDASLPDDAREGEGFVVRFNSAHDYEVLAEGESIARGVLDVPLVTPVATFTLHAGSHGTPRAGAMYELGIAPLAEMVDSAISALSVTVPKAGASGGELVKVVTLEYPDQSPQRAAVFLKQLMETYLSQRQTWKTENATAAESFVIGQLQGMRDSLDDTEKKLAEYRSNTRVVVLDNEAKALIEQVGKYEEQRVAARLQVAALADIKRVLKQPNPPVEAYLLGEAHDTVLEGLGRSLSESRKQLVELEGRFHDTAPDVRNLKVQVNAQLDTIRNYVTSRLARSQENLGALSSVIGQFENKLRTVPGAELGLAQLARESDVYSKLYSNLLERKQQAAILKASTVSKNRILDMPEIARRESSPRLGMRLASGVFGLLLGVLIVLLRRVFASTLQSEADVRSVIAGTPILAQVPRWKRPPGAAHTGASAPSFDTLALDDTSPFAEAFRTVRTSIYQAGRERAGQVLLVTSPTPGDGKTTTTLSLAAMLAADGKWVLVVDADLRKPSHHMLMGHHDTQGLRGVLSGQCHWRDVVHPVRVAQGEFFSIGAGKMSPAELISSERMARFLLEARSRYDFVLLDAPSFPLVADPLVLAPHADAVLSVMRLDHTPGRIAAEHVKRLSEVAHGFGVVVNGGLSEGPYGYGTGYPAPAKRKSWFSRLKRAST
jgi:tyrosine-protein kinase Etk/Wzc